MTQDFAHGYAAGRAKPIEWPSREGNLSVTVRRSLAALGSGKPPKLTVAYLTVLAVCMDHPPQLG